MWGWGGACPVSRGWAVEPLVLQIPFESRLWSQNSLLFPDCLEGHTYTRRGYKPGDFWVLFPSLFSCAIRVVAVWCVVGSLPAFINAWLLRVARKVEGFYVMYFIAVLCSDCFNSLLTLEAGDAVAQLGCPHSCFAVTRADRHNVGFPVSLFP